MLKETPEDKIREARVALEFMLYYNERRDEPVYGQDIGMLDKSAPDVRLRRESDDKVVGYLEIKARPTFTKQFMEQKGGLVMRKKKYDGMMERVGNYPLLYVVALADAWVFHDMKSDQVRFASFTGMTHDLNGNEWDETELHAFFRPEDMKVWYVPPVPGEAAFDWPDQSQWIKDYDRGLRNADYHSK